VFSTRPLEFDRIVEAVAGLALTPFGARELAALVPLGDPKAVAASLDATSEAVSFLETHDLFPLRAGQGLDEALAGLGIEGRPLEPLQLRGLADFLDSLEKTGAAIAGAGAACPILRGLAGRLASFAPEIAAIRRAIDGSGEITDEASPALGSLRESLRQKRQKLRATLDHFVRGRDTAKYLQEDVITERNGRLVIVVRAEHRANVPGIVHGSSTTGASLFLEPAATVEIGNDIVETEERERAEIFRILLALTERLRKRPGDLRVAVDVATRLDVLQAKARYGARLRAVEPVFALDGRLELKGARHPLLASAVPVDVLVRPPVRALLITGPNTGGKTVAIKTVGLLALMAQAGLHVPAQSATLPVFRSVFADIGDEQSITASLSTFSAHITNIVSMDREMALPSLVLLDEVGTGTDPNEGGALATAIVSHFKQRGAMVIATTHYDALKTWGTATEGVTTAAFAFDPQTFAPTYQLVYGAPGRSLALEIAQRHGLPLSVVAAARGFLSDDQKRLAAHLDRVDAQARALEQERTKLARDRRAVDEATRAIENREQALAEREGRLSKRLSERLDDRVRLARREIDQVIDEMRARSDALVEEARRTGLTTGAAGAVRADALSAVGRIVERARGDAVTVESAAEPGPLPLAPARPAGPVELGARVAVPGFGMEGIVVGLSGSQAEVDVRGKRLRAKVKELRVVAPPSPASRASADSADSASAASRVKVNVTLREREGLLSELNVIGCTVDEAIDRVSRFLDDTMVTDLREVRIVHGFGTGQLRKGIRKFLKDHPLVASVSSAPENQGGGGATVVELKE
jgi:DNA mismatch repair protein MutS2